MAGRTVPVEVAFLGNTASLEKALVRAGIVAEESSKKIAGSAVSAGAAAAEQARTMGASSDQIAAAAGRAAAVFTEANAKITASQKAAGDAAARSARSVGASLDEQKAAYARAIATQAEYEASSRRAADAAVAASRTQAAAARAAADAQAAAAKKSKAANDSLSKMGGKVLALGSAGLGAAAYEGVKGMVALQKAMEMLHTQAGSTQAEVGQLTKGVLNMATSVGTSPQTLADGMYHVASSLNATLPAATRAATELKVLRVAAEGAKAGNADLVDVTNALDAAIVSGIKGAQNYKQAMGELNATVGAGDMHMQDLADAYGKGVAVMAQMAGVSLKSLGGALAVLGDNNIRGAAAGTLMTSALRIMKAPSDAAAKALKAVNISSTELGDDLRSGGIVKALSDLKQKLVDAGATGTAQGLILTRAFGGRQSTGVSVLLDQLDRLKAKTEQVGAGANAFGRYWHATTQTTAFQLDQLKATVQKLADEFGAYLIPKLEAAAHALADVVQWLGRHKAAAQALAAVIEGVLGVAVATFAVNKAALFVGSIRSMALAVGKMASGIISVVPSVLTKFGLIGPAATAAETEVVAADEGIVVSADTTAAGVDAAFSSTGIGAVLVGLSVAAVELGTHWGDVMSAMKSAVNAMVEAAETALNGLLVVLNGAISLFNSTIGQLTGSIASLGSVSVSPAFGPGGGPIGMKGGNTLAGAGVNPQQQWLNYLTGTTGAPAPLNTHGHRLGAFPSTLPTAAGGTVKVPSSSLSKYLNGAAGGGSAASKAKGPARVISSHLTKDQQIFAAELSIKTGLDPQVIAGWLIAEESGGAASSRQAAGNNDWLNIGYTDSGTYGSTGTEWRNPIAAANATAGWLAGRNTVPGYGTASGGIQSILGTAGQSVAAQVAALQRSGWASSGYPGLAQDVASIGHVGITGGATSGATPVTRATVRSLLYANPFAGASGLNMERIDMGQDASMAPGSNIGAIGAGKVLGIQPNWYKGQDYMAYQLTQGPNKGKVVYLAEQINPTVHAGQTVKAGQTIAKYASSGTGIEMGFANPANWRQTLAQATTGYTEGQVTPAGQAFAKFLAQIGSRGLYTTTSYAQGGAGTTTGGGQSIEATIAKLIQALLTALNKTATSLLTKYINTIQNGTVRTLENLLGVSTSSGVSGQIHRVIERLGPNASLGQITAGQKHPSRGWLSPVLAKWLPGHHAGHKGPATLMSILEGSITGKPAYEAQLGVDVSKVHGKALHGLEKDLGAKHHTSLVKIVTDINGTHGKALAGLEKKLTHSHNKSLQRLGHEVKAGPAESPQKGSFDKLIAQLNATHVKGLEALATKLVAAHKAALEALSRELYAAQLTKDSELLTLQDTQTKDQTTLIANADADRLTVAQAQAQKVTDAAQGATQYAADQAKLVSDQSQAQTQYIKDMSQTAQDQFAAMAQAVKDQTTLMADASNTLVGAINDQTQTQVDTLNERGLFGLNLVAQQLQVQLDVMKAGFDQQINLAQQNLDALQAQADAAEAAAQISLDQVTTAEDQLVALSQQNLDTVTLGQDAREAAAQAHADSVTIAEDQQIAKAQAHVDAVTAIQNTNVQLAQQAVDLSSNAPKSVQDVLNAKLAIASKAAGLAIDTAGQTLQNVTDTATRLISTASTNYTNVQSAATRAIQDASNAYSAASDNANLLIGNASSTLTSVTGQFNLALAGASQGLQGLENTAAQQEAVAQGKVNVTGAEASTQYAGSGLVVNMYGINPSDAAANAGELGWVLRTQVPA